MKVTNTVHHQWIDMGMDRMFENFNTLDKSVVRAGVVGDAARRPSADGRLTMGEVALIVNFGARGIPPRDFIRSALHTPLAMKLAEDVIRTAISFGNTDAALNRAGDKLANEMKRSIEHGDFRPNEESTVRKKKSDDPLIDTRQLINAIGHELVRMTGK